MGMAVMSRMKRFKPKRALDDQKPNEVREGGVEGLGFKSRAVACFMHRAKKKAHPDALYDHAKKTIEA